jgi:hypothetical protein
MTTTEQERAALRRWYGDDAPRMEALFASASAEAHEEAAWISDPGCTKYVEGKAAARDAAWAIIWRVRDAREAAAVGGAR